jgi:hypothetical protein
MEAGVPIHVGCRQGSESKPHRDELVIRLGEGARDNQARAGVQRLLGGRLDSLGGWTLQLTTAVLMPKGGQHHSRRCYGLRVGQFAIRANKWERGPRVTTHPEQLERKSENLQDWEGEKEQGS